ncbi:member of major facilitator superfamily multidrug-resistance, DHA1 sub-family [Mycena belliarum]|uniref:Member of major facilitator superfamily multidrug-resistance, DHA1 sub-family n=1 Tax=Mycena belliarum TaxID=1033014 RepID=A0AAD6UH51_9AGAR|nr:member of major facilitator superfamily multidrug-resistance, DHA1 sub-family [Mycena belliae]
MSDNERQPLLPDGVKKKTPLPWLQLFILLWVQLAEPITSQVIYPFVNKLVFELPISGGDPSKVGYYAGLIESLFFVTEACTVLYWSSLSDRVGRRPILLTGLFGLTLSMVAFGLSRSFTSVVIARCLAGLLNGNVGVIKSMMGELTDETNIAQGMALMPVVWSTGAIVGPMIGGWLSSPAEQYPNSFFAHVQFFTDYPYALPCFVVAAYCATAWLLTFVFLKETVIVKPVVPGAQRAPRPSIKTVLIPRVLIAVANYSLIAFLDMSLRALQPLFYTSPIALGGLAFGPSVVGSTLAAFGLVSGLWQAFAFSPIYERLGLKNVFVLSQSTFLGMFALFPLMSLAAQRAGHVNAAVWTMLAAQGVLYVIMDMGFSCAFIYVRASAPSKHLLGATNGLAQTSISVVRSVGPALSNSLFAVTAEKNLLGGSFVYVFYSVITAGALYVATPLPKSLEGYVGDREDEE